MAGLLQVEHLTLPNPDDHGKPAFIIRNVFSSEECAEMLRRTEEIGYVPALVNVGGGREMLMMDVRNSLRCIIDDVDLASVIFDRVKSFIPAEVKFRKVVGLNERLRFLKYEPGNYFAPHYDGCYVRPGNGETSMLTLQLYLSGGAKGGETRFLPYLEGEGNAVDVVPEPGLVLVFKHDILHEGAMVAEGKKYVMRTDVMYTSDE